MCWWPVLDRAESQRLAHLFDRQANGALSAEERAELEELVNTYGRRLRERSVAELAARRGISLEEARGELEAGFGEVVKWWHKFEGDPSHRVRVTVDVKQRLKEPAPL